MKNILRLIVVALVVAGSINWGLVGLYDYNFIEKSFAAMPMLKNATYVAYGLAGLLLAYFTFDECMC